MTERTLHLSLPNPRPENLVPRVQRDLQDHFGGLACRSHDTPLAVTISEHAESLTCVLAACCELLRDQLDLHLSCVGEIAAMHGLSLVPGEPVSAG